MPAKLYAQFTEVNGWEDETWHRYFPIPIVDKPHIQELISFRETLRALNAHIKSTMAGKLNGNTRFYLRVVDVPPQDCGRGHYAEHKTMPGPLNVRAAAEPGTSQRLFDRFYKCGIERFAGKDAQRELQK